MWQCIGLGARDSIFALIKGFWPKGDMFSKKLRLWPWDPRLPHRNGAGTSVSCIAQLTVLLLGGQVLASQHWRPTFNRQREEKLKAITWNPVYFPLYPEAHNKSSYIFILYSPCIKQNKAQILKRRIHLQNPVTFFPPALLHWEDSSYPPLGKSPK